MLHDSPTAPEPARLCYSINAFAAATGLSRSTVYAEIRSGKLRAKRRGCRTIIPAQNAAAYLASLPDVPAAQAA
jgi:hypothetical protein